MKGTAQSYFDRAFDEMTDAGNPSRQQRSGYQSQAAPNSRAFVPFRKFGDSKFTDLIKGFEGKNNRMSDASKMIDYGDVAPAPLRPTAFPSPFA